MHSTDHNEQPIRFAGSELGAQRATCSGRRDGMIGVQRRELRRCSRGLVPSTSTARWPRAIVHRPPGLSAIGSSVERTQTTLIC